MRVGPVVNEHRGKRVCVYVSLSPFPSLSPSVTSSEDREKANIRHPCHRRMSQNL